MVVFKCKMCGGALEIQEGMTVCECEYCGSKQTVPKLDDEKKITLFTRANRLRSACEFDKASSVYESILADFPEEAEAYWGLLLCKYGIEYVDDPRSGKKIPTCHRSSFDSIVDDQDFEMVMEYSDPGSRSVYRDEAKKIEELRISINEVSSKEEPYDIFICYKETDLMGERTIDSVIAQDVYDALTEKGYRVFFSRISLEDKLGQEYEPYIFAALNSAKVMLAFGTDFEYYNAVWVKNEWSRFLSLIEKGEKKTLIPCFKGIDAYDMPKEFARLQAQDMGKVGAIQDLLRGIDKILDRKVNKEKHNDPSTMGIDNKQASTVEPILKRAFMFLEDGDWKKADDFSEQVLNNDPENALAYVAKVMALLHVHRKEELGKLPEPFEDNGDYKKALRFANESLMAELQGYNDSIKNKKNEATYQRTVKCMSSAKIEEDYDDAIKGFQLITDYKDSRELIEKCKQLKQIMSAKSLLANALTEEEISQVLVRLEEYKDIPEINELILNGRAEHGRRITTATDLWKKYISDKELSTNCEAKQKAVYVIIVDKKNEIKNLRKNMEALEKLKDESQALYQKIRSCNGEIKKLTSQLDAEKKDLSQMGILAISAKKEAKERIAGLQGRINKKESDLSNAQQRYNYLQSIIPNGKSKESTEQDILSIEKTLKPYEQEVKEIEKRKEEIGQEIKNILNEVLTPEYLAALLGSDDDEIFKGVLSDQHAFDTIRNDVKLIQIAEMNPRYQDYFNLMPGRIKKNKYMENGNTWCMDDPTRYYQACKQMENGNIWWAAEQFAAIKGYKDSDLKLTLCKEKIKEKEAGKS